jgi:AraC-like DNA-binding protein
MVSFDPNRPDFAPYGFTCVRWNPTPMRRPDRHNEIELNFLQTGWVTYLLGGRKVRVEANHLSAFWAAIPHQIIEFGGDTNYFVATIPLPWFLQCRLPDNLVHPLLQAQLVSVCTPDRSALDTELFTQWERDLREPTAEQKRAVLLEMEARLLRFALDAPPLVGAGDSARKRPTSLSEGGLNKAEQMACLIAQRYTERLTVDQIGQTVKLHPNYAMSLFQRTFGTTLIEYLTQHRVLHAQRLLATTNQKIVDVAFASGFSSISRFNDAFRRACSCSPREYRRQHQLED